MKRYIMTLIAFSLSVMAINGAEKSDGIDAFPYRDLIEKYVASSDFGQSKINVTDYTFWIFIEISNDRIVLMDTNATSRH